MMNESMPVLVEVTRGPIVESKHRGVICALEPDGHTVHQLGDATFLSSTRSTIKPFQAIPVITSGAADAFHFTDAELALICASHGGEALHTEAAAALLQRIGLDESALLCGAQEPFHEATARALRAAQQPSTQLHNNCSGKHTGMLATAVHRGLAIADYIAPAHPLQREIVSVFARFAGLGEHLPTGIDGCSAPTFGVPLASLALAFARLVSGWDDGDERTAAACKRIVAAMTTHPQMVGGTGRFDTALLAAAAGKLVCKVGAEAVYSVGVLPCEAFPRGLGLAFKMEDGSYRGLGPVVIETLAQLGVLSAAKQEELQAFHRPKVENRRLQIVGSVNTVFRLL